MNTRFVLFVTTFVALTAFAVPNHSALAQAQVAPQQQKQLTPQQQKMKDCNAQATAQKLSGDARKTFMSNCLKAQPAKTLAPQQEKMKACNTQATAEKLSGDARKAFMSNCLKKP